MWIVKRTTLRGYWQTHRRAEPSLKQWLAIALHAEWRSISDVRRDFRDADPVAVASGRTVTVFNIGGGRYRLVTAIHYNTGKLFALRFMTHAEYDKQQWKAQL